MDQTLRDIVLVAVGLVQLAGAPAQAPAWRPVPELTDRIAHMVAYDPVRERTVLFGGATVSASPIYLDDTWEWDGRRWELRDVRTKPAPRAGAAIAYDHVRGTVLLFGGGDGKQRFVDTWEWDGRDWRQVPTAAAPSARDGVEMASDPLRRRIVLFGGGTGVVPPFVVVSNDTWEWDGARWQQLAPRTVPPARGGQSMAYSVRTRRVVMTGGRSAGLDCHDTRTVWEWDGVDWTMVYSPGATSAVPGQRCGNAMATDPITGCVIMHGTSKTGPGQFPADTWRWNGVRWQKLAPTLAPPTRDVARMATDFARREIVLTGGGGSLPPTPGQRPPGRDTWAFDGAIDQWRLAHVWPKPAGGAYQIAFDSVRGRFLLVGRESYPALELTTWSYTPESGFARLSPVKSPPGYSASGSVNSAIEYHAASGQAVYYSPGDSLAPFFPRTWVFDGSTWRWQDERNQDPTLPYSHSVRMAYDPKRAQVLMYVVNAKELWAWDPGGWRRVSAAEPNLPDAFGVAFDVHRDRLVLHGRIGSGFGQPDTWEWDGRAWHHMRPANPGVVGTHLEYVPVLGGCVLLGANFTTTNEESWLWDGSNWQPLPVAPLATKSYFDTTQAVAYDPSRQRMLAIHHMHDRDALANSVHELRLWSLGADRPHPRPGDSVTFSIELAAQAGKAWLLGLALSNTRGVPLRPSPMYGQEWLPLDPDALLAASLDAGLGGVLDPAGRATFTLPIPLDSALVWLRFHAAAFAWSSAGPSIDAITNSVDLQIVR